MSPALKSVITQSLFWQRLSCGYVFAKKWTNHHNESKADCKHVTLYKKKNNVKLKETEQ